MNETLKTMINDGFKVFPVVKNGKRPAMGKWQDKATTDEAQIEYWDNQFHGPNWGLATGQSGILIIDIDNHGEDGLANLKKWVEENGKFPFTKVVKTPNSGYHLYYKNSDECLKNRAGIIPGIDIRANGGLVVAPPSQIDGREYRWLSETEVKKELGDILLEYDVFEIPQVNDIVLALYDSGAQETIVQKQTTKSSKVTKVKKKSNNKENEKKQNVGERFVLPDVIKEGTRDDTLFRYGSSLRGKGYEENEIITLIKSANQNNCEAPLDDYEIDSIINQVLGYQSGKKPSTEIGVKLPQGKDKEYVYLTDSKQIAASLAECGYRYFVLNAYSQVSISKNKDRVTYVCCGSMNFIQEMNGQLGGLGAKYSKIIWLAFLNKKLLEEGKEASLAATIYELKEIEEKDPAAFLFEDTILYVENNSYYVKGKYKRCISNFVVEIVEQLDVINDEGMTVSSEYIMDFHLYNQKTLRKRVQSSVFSSARQFKNWLKSDSIELSYMGCDNELELIQLRIQQEAKNIPIKIGIDHTGIVLLDNKWVYVGLDKSFYGDGTVCEDIVAVLEESGVVYSDIANKDKINSVEMEELLKSLFEFNVHQVTIPIVAWSTGAFFKERLKHIGWKMPHLLIIGEAGSGKSSATEDILMKIHGIKSAPLSCDKLTTFSSLKALSSSNLTPIILEEYKPSRIGTVKQNLISGILRDTYDGHTVRRGTASLKVIEFAYRSPLVLVGESSTEEKAIKDRTIETTCSLYNRTMQHTDNYFFLKKNDLLLEKLGRSILNKALLLSDDEILDMLEECLHYFQKTTEFVSRNQLGLAVMLFSIRILKMIAADLNLDFMQITNIDGDEVARALIGNITSALGDGTGTRSKTEVEKTLEVFATLAKENLIIRGVHYEINDRRDELCFYLKDLYMIYSKYHKDYNLTADIDFLSKNSFSKQLRLSKYFVTCDKRTFTRKTGLGVEITNPKCFVLKRSLVKQNLDMDNM